MVLANDAEPDAAAGDPLEIGLLAFARDQGIDIHALRANHPRVSLRAFDSAWKFMRVTVDSVAGPRSVLKGAPEVLLDRCHLEPRSEEHTSELQSLMRISYAVFCLKKKQQSI